MKKFISVLLAFAMLLCLLLTTAFAEGEVTYTLQAGKNYKISNSDGERHSITIGERGFVSDTERYDFVCYDQAKKYADRDRAGLTLL